MSTKPGAGIWRTGAAFGSLIHTLFGAHIADKQSHPANGTPTDTAGRPLLWRSRSETGEASSETAVGSPSYTTCWGLLKQPDNQKMSRWFYRHRIVGTLIATVLGLAVIEGALLLYYLSSWLTLPL